ncbi:MAG: GNAT family N-acetyltransferase [Pseudomonadota bacterium]
MNSAAELVAYTDAEPISPAEAAKMIQPGQTVFLGSASGTPRTVLTALEARMPPPPDVTLLHFLTSGAYQAAADHAQEQGAKTAFRHRVFFVGSDIAPFTSTGKVDYVPMRLSEVPRLLENGRISVDVAIIQVSPPNENGYVSLGVSVDITRSVVRNARTVIAEVNPQMPFTYGDTFLHISNIDAMVEVDHPLPTFDHTMADDVGKRIAAYVAGVIEDGSTIQFGLGRVPNEVMRHLSDRRDLGIHTDAVTEGILDLIASGAISSNANATHGGKIVASYCVGSEALYRYVDRNPLFQFYPIEEVCDPVAIAAHPRMVSITQAFAIDLTGQACIDQLDGELYGGVSTQPDFMRGASRSPGGKPIICLSALAEDGVSSRIRPHLQANDAVGIPRSDAHYVITEYGIAYLFGKSLGERALALIEIAHPDHRATLLDYAKEAGLVSKRQPSIHARSYPIEAEAGITLRDGRSVMVRPARASDAVGLQTLFHKLPAEDVYARFFQRLKSLPLEAAQNLCNVDHTRDVAFVAVTGPREDERIVGSACYFLNETSNLAETAFIVDPNWQSTGLGRHMQNKLRSHAEARGIRGFIAEVLTTNERMLRLARAATQDVSVSREEDCYHITMLF